MANSPTEKSKDFIKSGMTLITQVDSDKYLKRKMMNEQQNHPESEQSPFPESEQHGHEES